MFFLGFDIETSGQSVNNHALLAIGACVVDSYTQQVPEPRDTHTCRLVLSIPSIDNEPSRWEKRCFDEFWQAKRNENNGATPLELLYKLASAHGTHEPDEGMRRFWAWLRTMYELHPQLQIITDTVGFDTGWINAYLSRYLDSKRIFYTLEYAGGSYNSIRCVNDWYLGLANVSLISSSKDAFHAVLRTHGIDAVPAHIERVTHNHDPLCDAERMTLKAAFVHKLITEKLAADDDDSL